MRSIVKLSLIVMVGAFGCGMEGDEAFAQDLEHDFALAEQAATTTYRYSCNCIPASGPRGRCYSDWETMSITVSSTRATTSLAAGARFTYDARYQPAAANAGYSRYTGAAAGGSAALLVEKKLRTSGGYALRTGGKGGYARYTVRSSDGFDNQKFICRLR